MKNHTMKGAKVTKSTMRDFVLTSVAPIQTMGDSNQQREREDEREK